MSKLEESARGKIQFFFFFFWETKLFELIVFIHTYIVVSCIFITLFIYINLLIARMWLSQLLIKISFTFCRTSKALDGAIAWMCKRITKPRGSVKDY